MKKVYINKLKCATQAWDEVKVQERMRMFFIFYVNLVLPKSEFREDEQKWMQLHGQ